MNAGKARSWSLDMLFSGDDVEGQVTGILVLVLVLIGLSKGIVNVDAILVSICLRCAEGSSDVGFGRGCTDLEIMYGLALSSDFMRTLACCGDAL